MGEPTSPGTVSPLRLVVHGAAGRMGRRVIACATADDLPWRIVAAVERSGHPRVGADAGALAGVSAADAVIAESWSCPADVVVDFSLPDAVTGIVGVCREKRLPLVIATTGLGEPEHRAIAAAATSIAILHSPSMSLAVNVAMELTARAAGLLRRVGSRADVEIIEWHHRHKEDAPSGTALKFGAIVREALGQGHESHGRSGRPGPRPPTEIGYHAVRAGDNPGEHSILFGLEGESLTVGVRATDRDCYARGALAAARFLVDRPPGVYSMRDVLGLA